MTDADTQRTFTEALGKSLRIEPTPDTARLRELLAEATPGPWHVLRGADDGHAYFITAGGRARCDMTGPYADRAAIAALIAELRNAAPAILDALDAERAARVAAEQRFGACSRIADKIADDAVRWKARAEAAEAARVAAEAQAFANRVERDHAEDHAREIADDLRSVRARADRAEAKADRLTEALVQIAEWSDAYPTKVFPKPDLAQAAVVLARAGLSLDIITADAMRHATEGVGEIARTALRTEGE